MHACMGWGAGLIGGGKSGRRGPTLSKQGANPNEIYSKPIA